MKGCYMKSILLFVFFLFTVNVSAQVTGSTQSGRLLPKKQNMSTENQIDTFAPTLTIVEPSVTRGIKVVKKSEVTMIKGYAIDPSGVLEVKVNNQRASLSDKGEFSVELFLKMGDNPIVVQAIDSYMNSKTDTFTITRKLEDIVTIGKYVALVIGINSYEGYWRPLKTAVNDATELAEVLKKDYRFNEVHTLIDQDATR